MNGLRGLVPLAGRGVNPDSVINIIYQYLAVYVEFTKAQNIVIRGIGFEGKYNKGSFWKYYLAQ